MDLSPDDDNFQGRLLHQAALWDNLELLQELLATGASADSRDASRRSALHAAALAERSRCLAALIDAGADVDARSDERTGGKTALHIAAERGHVENVLVLVSRGASLNVLDAAGDTALALAERARRRHAAQALREARDAQERERASQHKQLRELVARGEAQLLRGRLAALGPAAGLIVNLTPAGGNTLLYMASEAGLATAVAALLDAGADGRAHPATKYAPLHAACYRGHLEVAKLLMQQFPEAVQQETVEKWLPLHAACIGGHAALVTHILEFPYPENLLTTYTDSSGRYTYRLAFDVNARDASGQSALHAACALGALPAVEALLAFSVVGNPVEGTQPPLSPAAVLSPHRAGISLGIHAIVSKLTGGKAEQSDREHHVRPVRLDLLHGGDGVVACAVRAGHARVAKRLLAAGAPPDAPARAPDDEPPSPRDRRRSRSASAASRASSSPSPARGGGDAPWSALALAARAKDIATAEALLQHGATDPHGRALRECARHGLTDLMAAILATKAYPDPDYKLNKSSLSESVFAVSRRDGDAALTYSAVCPAAPVAVAWRGLDARLVTLRMSWLRQASLRVNSKLSSGGGALHAITRLDIANNELRALPAELFTLLSLRHLNAAQNKLERLPSPSDPFEDEIDSKGRKIKRGKKSRLEVYSAPVLQELYLQDNRLEDLPPSLFSLPSLTTLDVSNNKLRALPDTMWTAPALRDLSAALNHLKDLPTGSENRPQSSPSQSSLSESPQPAASPANGSSQFVFTSQNTNSSRSPSIERSESSEILDDDDAIPTLGSRAGHAVCTETRRAHPWRDAPPPPPPPRGGTPLVSLNLSHNQFTAIPAALACRAPALQRLNMAYNSLRTMSYVTSYPTSLRQLDLSHNEITCWPSLPQLDNLGAAAGDPLACHCPGGPPPRAPRRGPARRRLLGAACPARTHLRLEGLRTLILSNNMLTRIQLTTDDDGLATPETSTGDDDDDEWGAGLPHKGRLLFPLLSMLDVSCNLLRTVPPAIHELTSLAVLNISGNKEITDLPPQMGLLSRLWNLNTVGCSLNEPLRSMVSSGRYKSMDIVGYLLSVLQEARPYARCKLMVVGLQGLGKTSLLECLRQESSIQHRRKPTDHWARRMGNKSSKRNVSTVGVDIGAWVYEKQRSARGPVTFRTWDFGGQHEYYATHQYFLSRRSLYLVVWKVTDGKKGLAGALEWLRSIQARAPGSSVIMVATHYDQVANSNLPESESPEALQRLIRSAVMGAPDADKLGLPRVVDSLEVSCSTRHNIRLLADIIYSVAFSVKPPGSKEPLLEQLVPATYLALEECVTALAADEPVLRHDRYKALVTQYMQQKNLRMFRDAAELHQATMFLHENGVLLHYDDATLKELYFLRPQWLCDVLAHVVTVREINPFAQNGIMKLEDLAHVFKASPQLSRGTGEEASALGVSLLGKFELALCWDARVLLVPPLLPVAEPKEGQLPLRNRPWGAPRTPRRVVPAAISLAPASAAAAAVPLAPALDHAHGTDSPTLIQEPLPGISIAGRSGAPAVRRLLLLSYVPCGFWPRLCTRVLADNALAEAAAGLYRPPAEVEVDDSLSKALELPWRWKLWRTGLRLACGGFTMAVLRELPALADPVLGIDEDPNDDREHPYRGVRFRVMLEGAWSLLSPSRGASVELELPALVAVLRRQDGLPIGGYQSISLEPHPETLARLLALLADHVDLLLEDWYPSLGTRFVHTSEGRCLITRLVPCPACLRDASDADRPGEQAGELAQALNRLELAQPEPRRARVSEESRTSDGDSGVGAESNASSRIGSVEGAGADPPRRVAHAWTVEECILGSCTAQTLRCPRHGADARLRDVAPDTLLLDVPESHLARWSSVSLHSVAGRGAFGTVLSGTWRRAPVAVKALQPVPPPKGGELTDTHAYKAALSRWEREPLTAACRAYCGLRQELTVLRQLKHAHVAPLVAVCSAPLALLLALAPMGALDGVLRSYRSAGERVGARAARLLALQAARALEYLHAKRVVYRDLKSENVLVWAMPPPAQARAAELSAKPMDVHIKLGDYGISRLTPPSGTKGFGGTEGFMAPEIMRYNGEEEYNEKVDCFSYGMLLYEIVALRQPFEGHEAVKEAVLDGARPPLSSKELHYPCCILETMRRCWHSAPGARPSAAALASLAAAPEYAALQDAAGCHGAAAAVGVPVLVDEDSTEAWEVWYGGEPGRVHALLTAPDRLKHHHSVTLPVDEDTSEAVSATAICRVGNKVWVGDSAGRVLVYCASTCQLSWRARPREAVGGARSRVAALQHLPAARRVALALACGRMFLVTSSRPALEGGFVLTELGTATDLRCLAAVPTPKGFEVWAGGDSLTAYSISNGGVCGAEAVAAAEGVAAAARVTLLAAADEEPYVIVCFEPGTCIYQYCVRTRAAAARLDCSKLAPCSESLQSSAVEDGLPAGGCRITSLCAVRGVVAAGTARGCVLLADAGSLRPLTVFRPYEGQVSCLIPLPRHGSQEPMLVSLGSTYRPLVQRFTPNQNNSTNSSQYSGPYCLLWRTQRWLPD